MPIWISQTLFHFADPDSDSPKASAKWNRVWEIQMRELRFPGLKLDADGYLEVEGGSFRIDDKVSHKIDGIDYDLHACHVDETEAEDGLAPHGYAKVYPRVFSKKLKKDVQKVEVDWRYDVFRPTRERKALYEHGDYYFKKLFPRARDRKALTDDQRKALKKAEREDADNKKIPWEDKKLYDRGRFTAPFLVIHITDGPRFESQLQTLTSDAAIHYLVCLNGHVVKIAEDAKGCYHAGWHNVAVWRDFVWGGKINCNKTSIGIEHAAGKEWPEAEIAGSVRIAKRICEGHQIPPCAVVRHRDLGGSSGGVHVAGKECPGTEAPWGRYMDHGVTLWPLGTRDGESEVQFPSADGFFHGIFDVVTFIDDTLSGTEKTPANEAKQKAAIKELKGYLTLIGYWVTKTNKSNEDKYDAAATHCVRMCQERFMIGRSKETGDPKLMPRELGRVDRATAKVIYAVCQHRLPVLPPLQTR